MPIATNKTEMEHNRLRNWYAYNAIYGDGTADIGVPEEAYFTYPEVSYDEEE